MKSNQQFSHSYKHYTKLGKTSKLDSLKNYLSRCSIAQRMSPKLQKLFLIIGHYFCMTTHYAPIAMLPATLLYLNFSWFAIPSFVYITVITIFFLGVLYQMQDRLLYYPDMPETSRIYVAKPPSSIPHEEVSIPTIDGVVLHGYLLKQENEKLQSAPTIVYFHGNAGNAASPSIIPLYKACEANVLVIDYRGFGKSTGFPSENGLYRDGEAAVSYLHSRTDVNLNKIVLFGHSLGGAVSIHIASKSQWVKGRIAAVILENTFTNLPATAVSIFESFLPFLQFLPTFCFKNKFESIDKVADIQVPILFIYGASDVVVPPAMSRALYEASGNPRSAIVEIRSGSHNDTWCVSTDYQYAIIRFLRKVFKNSSDASRSWSVPEKSEDRMAMSHEWAQVVFPPN